MNTPKTSSHEHVVARINGQVAFLNAAMKALGEGGINRKLLSQMLRGITAIRSSLRYTDSPDLEAFSCDLCDLLGLLDSDEIQFNWGMIELVRRSVVALGDGVRAMQYCESVADEIQDVRDAVFSVLLDHAVTVKRCSREYA